MYERVENSVILVCKKAQNKGPFSLERTHRCTLLEPAGRRLLFSILHFSYGCEKAENTLDVYSYIESVHLQQLKGMQSSKQGTEKGHHLSIEGIRNIVGTFFCQK